MARPRSQVVLAPRGLTLQQVADYLGRGETWLKTHHQRLVAHGFPAMDPLTGRYDRLAIDRWLDCRAGFAVPDAAQSAVAAILDGASDPFLQGLRDV